MYVDEPVIARPGSGRRAQDGRWDHGWSQAELAAKIGGDAAQISRYENGRITPSADVIIRLSEIFDVTDYLLLEDAPKRPQRNPDEAALGDRISAVSELGEDDLALVTSFIDALVTKTRLKVLASGS